MSQFDDEDRALADARKSGDADRLAEALTMHADRLIKAGQIARARLALDEAATIHRARGRAYDEARCTHMAATLCRLEGKLDEARERALRAESLVPAGSPVKVSAATELGEIALAEKNGPAAVDAYGRALGAGREAGLIESARAALLRKRANALVMSGLYTEAAADLEEAHRLLEMTGDRAAATRALVEQAAALHQGGETATARQAIFNATERAKATGDDHALADLYLLEATQAVDRRDLAAAMKAAQEARTHALSAVAPLSYIGAAFAIAELAEASGDRIAAYEALAVGWVTAGDVLGRDAAKAIFEPKLLELRNRWGAQAFADVKSAYEARRLAEKNRG